MLSLRRFSLISVFISVALALIVFPLGCTTSEPKQMVFTLSIQHKELQESSTLSVKQNDDVVLNIKSDEKALFHLHGYDLEAHLEPNTASTLSFKANATGKFDFEMHIDEHAGKHSHDHEEEDSNKIHLGSLEVHPR